MPMFERLSKHSRRISIDRSDSAVPCPVRV
jgi:hypothetical protein